MSTTTTQRVHQTGSKHPPDAAIAAAQTLDATAERAAAMAEAAREMAYGPPAVHKGRHPVERHLREQIERRPHLGLGGDPPDDPQPSRWGEFLAGRAPSVTLPIRRAVERQNLHTAGVTRSDVEQAARHGQALTVGETGDVVARALGVGTSTAGGDLVSDDAAADMIVGALRAGRSSMMTVARVVTTMGGEQMSFPTATPGSVIGETSEAATAAKRDATIGQITMNAYVYRAQTEVSFELAADGPAAEEALVHNLTSLIAASVDRRLLLGSGSSQPTGLLNSANNDSTMGTVATYSASSPLGGATEQQIENCLLGGRYENVSASAAAMPMTFVLPPTWFGGIRRVVDPQHVAGGMLFGSPIVLTPYSGPAAPSSASSDSIRFGAVVVPGHSYLVRLASDVEIMKDPYSESHTGRIVCHISMRLDGAPADTTSYATLTGPVFTA